MDTRWKQIEELFHDALDLPSDARAAFLQRNCADAVLRQEVEALLTYGDKAGGPIDGRAGDGIESLPESAPDIPFDAGADLGPYKITGILGAGGMGQVYRAQDTRLGRPVAIKVSRARFSGRFEREARAIAALNHPNICTLHDVGPNYLVMEI